MRHFSFIERMKQPKIIKAKDLVHMVSDKDTVSPEYIYLKTIEKIDVVVRTAQYFDERQIKYDYSDDNLGDNPDFTISQVKHALLQRGYHISYTPGIPVWKISW